MSLSASVQVPSKYRLMSWLSALLKNPITPTDRTGLFEVMTHFLQGVLEVIPEPGFVWLHVPPCFSFR